MPEPVHLLTNPGDPRLAAVVCGSPMAQLATWVRHAVTCPQCLGICALKPNNLTTQQPTAITDHLSEKQWLQQVVNLARQQGYLAYHPHTSQKSAPGWPDLALAKAGHPLILAELKTQQGALSGHQRLWLDVLWQTTGVVVAVWRPQDWDTVVQVLSGDTERDKQRESRERADREEIVFR